MSREALSLVVNSRTTKLEVVTTPDDLFAVESIT